MKPSPPRPLAVVLTTLMSVAIGLGCIYSGTALIADTSGGTLNIPTGLIVNLPIDNYLPVGIFLLILGLMFMVVTHGLWRNTDWSWPLAVAANLILGVWLLLGLVLIGLHFAHQPVLLVMVAWGLYLLFYPSTLNYTLSS